MLGNETNGRRARSELNWEEYLREPDRAELQCDAESRLEDSKYFARKQLVGVAFDC